LFIGRSRDRGATWSWKPLSRDSREDNLRPIVVNAPGGKLILLWMRGTYTYNRGEWTTRVEAAFLDRARITEYWDP
jgi:hypothetical protein